MVEWACLINPREDASGLDSEAVHATCRTASVSRTLGEVVEHAKATEDELRAAYDALNRELGLPTGPIDPTEYLPRFATRLDLPRGVERRARELATRAHESGAVAGRNPGGVAAACLYAAAREADGGCTQAEAAEVADVTPVTLRKAYYIVREHGEGEHEEAGVA